MFSDEQLRAAVRAIKHHLYRGGSSTHLPADSFITDAALEVLQMGAAGASTAGDKT